MADTISTAEGVLITRNALRIRRITLAKICYNKEDTNTCATAIICKSLIII